MSQKIQDIVLCGIMQFAFVLPCIFCFCIYLLPIAANASTVERQQGEDLTSFVTRQSPVGAEVTHKPLETSEWKFQDSVILAFYEFSPATNDNTGATKIVGFAYIPIGNSKYEKIEIDTYESEGGNPRVETVFFASTDKTKDKSLILIVSWEQNHATVQGTLYHTFVYACPNSSPLPQKLIYLQSISETLSGGCECWSDNEPPRKAKFKTAADIKAALKRLR